MYVMIMEDQFREWDIPCLEVCHRTIEGRVDQRQREYESDGMKQSMSESESESESESKTEKKTDKKRRSEKEKYVQESKQKEQKCPGREQKRERNMAKRNIFMWLFRTRFSILFGVWVF